MSGLEVAGLVLGAFPILLSALKISGDAARTVDDWFKISKIYEEFVSFLKVQQLAFETNMKIFLDPILWDDAELEELLTKAYSQEWRWESLASEIRDHVCLPRVYESFIEMVQQYHNRMVELGKELGIDKPAFQRKMKMSSPSSGKRPFDVRGGVEFELHRIKFSVNRKRRAGLMTGLETCNKNLKFLATKVGESQSPLQHNSPRKSTMPKSFRRCWQQAKDLYSLMQQSWCCNCCTSHTTNLLLRDPKDSQEIEFKVLFTFAEKVTSQHSGPWDWKEANIKGQRHLPSHQSAPTIDAVDGKSIVKSPNPPPENRLKKTKGVRFADSVVPSVNVTRPPPMQANRSAPKIANLCTDLTKAGSDEVELGTLASNSNIFTVNLPKQRHLAKSVLEHVTLYDILRSKPKWSFNNRQRYTIALAIASSYIQLHASPWIWTDWDKRDIFLLYDSDKAQFYEQPRISRRISTQPPPPRGQRDRSIVSLGIMLLELAFGQALEDNRFRQKWPTSVGQPDPFLDKAAAEEWCSNCADDEHPHFAEPVMWCLNHPTSRTKMDLNDAAWRKELFDNVVQPLSGCCSYNKYEVRDD